MAQKRDKPTKAKIKAYLQKRKYKKADLDAFPDDVVDGLLTLHGVTPAQWTTRR